MPASLPAAASASGLSAALGGSRTTAVPYTTSGDTLNARTTMRVTTPSAGAAPRAAQKSSASRPFASALGVQLAVSGDHVELNDVLHGQAVLARESSHATHEDGADPDTREYARWHGHAVLRRLLLHIPERDSRPDSYGLCADVDVHIVQALHVQEDGTF